MTTSFSSSASFLKHFKRYFNSDLVTAGDSALSAHLFCLHRRLCEKQLCAIKEASQRCIMLKFGSRLCCRVPAIRAKQEPEGTFVPSDSDV